ncbi:mycofactocin-coupled SDR family oxidoreductase [Pseudonocardia xishanensis]|uniref:Mycofactocin-coupled SDR family oxidoreductase n=1 Tax=Pseudonocardia xishanensis TaxID=630995 RepID=A0ABP8S3R1_9PSEU
MTEQTASRAKTGRFAGKVAYVTGAARGQGRSHALALAREGASIIAVDLCHEVDATRGLYPGSTVEDLETTASAIRDDGGRVVAEVSDVRDVASLAAVLDRGLDEFGRLDIVVANAGVFAFGQQTHEIPESAWREVIDINLTGVWNTIRTTVPTLLEQGTGGSIVLTSSAAGLRGLPNAAHYAASKHAVAGLMKSVAIELAPHSIRVNSLHPGSVATDMILNEALFRLFLPDHAAPGMPEARQALTATNLLPVPWVEPVDVTEALLFLASDEARYITGQEMKIDAGSSLRSGGGSAQPAPSASR